MTSAEELESLLPALKMKGEKGLIRASYYGKAKVLAGLSAYDDKQQGYVNFLIMLAKRQHRNTEAIVTPAATVTKKSDPQQRYHLTKGTLEFVVIKEGAEQSIVKWLDTRAEQCMPNSWLIPSKRKAK
jgi:hypothetical protein